MSMTWTDERPSEPGEYWVSIEPGMREATMDYLLLTKLRAVNEP